MNTTWKITTIRDGAAVSSVEGVSRDNAVRAIRNAMYGRDVFADTHTGAPQEQAFAARRLAA